ncbi:virulence factor family protein [Terrihabitans sp. B22-R8]|uniref:virulence factor family protein n=1 Tax=Terrihabitans sp. B22-R8 TaxID=3425128 RepID=UPI00403C0B50
MKIRLALLLAGLAFPAAAQEVAPPPPAPPLDAGLLGTPLILKPAISAKGVAYIVSGLDGWGAREQAAAEEVQAAGIAAIGIDLADYKTRLDADDGECLYLVSDLEGVSYQVQRELGIQTYRSPVIGGFAEGGGLVLSIAQQTPAATIGAAIAVDAEAPPTFAKPLCGLDADPPETGIAAIRALSTPAASQNGRGVVTAVAARGIAIEASDTADTPSHALAVALVASLAAPTKADDRLSALPLVELAATTPSDTIAIVYSGDGGWRDLDKTIAETFQARGVSTIGVDSLRYFWSEKKPEDVARDLKSIIDRYRTRWHAKHVLLVGYSFGADMLPEVFNLLPAATQKLVSQISLLGFSEQAGYEISVAGWLGQATAEGHPTLPELARIDPALIQCIYGREEDDSACPALAGKGIEIVETEGGHHFDEDYEALAARILEGARRRTH